MHHKDFDCGSEALLQYFFQSSLLLFQFSHESDSDSAHSRVMETHQSARAELEEDTPEEADVTVSYRPPSRKPKQTRLCLLDVFDRLGKQH